MDLSALFKQAGRAAAENSPAILTAVGATGVFTTAFLAAKAAFASVDILRDAEDAKKADVLGKAVDAIDENPEPGEITVTTVNGELTRKEQLNLVWKLYVPAAISAGMTITAIVCSNRISDKRTAAVAAAYSFAEKNFKEYREKTVAKMGKKKEQEVRDEVAQDGVTKNPPKKNEVIIVGNGTVLCRDAYSGRYFQSTMEAIRKAENDMNWDLLNTGYVSVSDWWHYLGLDSTSESDQLGWNTDTKFEVEYSTALTDQNEPCIVATFRPGPIGKFYRNNR